MGAQDGAKVWISSRKQDNVDAALDELRGMDLDVDGMVCHVGDRDQRHELIETVMEKDNALNILVSNAAVNPFFGSILDTPEASWDKIFDINVKNAFQLIQECVPYLSQNETSNITTISSIAGYQPMPMLGAYFPFKSSSDGTSRRRHKSQHRLSRCCQDKICWRHRGNGRSSLAAIRAEEICCS